ncbi:methyltransferase domain protein [Leptospira yanagawae serovar Saopaulo str. Sao Paulo = ATCC 700523]|uniref:Methyltransferase domain protein n=1 Tax=Leptospira yanagawae serovar Saopaulo str. Sao Paulo = ATCC 700523 TaxID=1249483 RepID=A0A5E8HDY2_9LEPT|nr:methyltransferase domain-containing protein [Leptospira yanagawae]EOQ88997.1 methyltransferase domain protein [Leptospira yanagawae serovar Saopaulo str. Sao Paulo = ATCC 700523]
MEKLRIKLEKWVNGGYCLAHHDGHAVFVEGGIPGETVDITLSKQGKKEWFGIVATVIEPSPLRIPSDCPDYLECGGCSYRHISYEEELKLKTSLLEFMFPNAKGKIEVSFGPSEGYRNNVQWQVEGNQIGFFAKNSHNIIPSSSNLCKNVDKRLLIDETNEIWKQNQIRRSKWNQKQTPHPIQTRIHKKNQNHSLIQKKEKPISLRLSQEKVVFYDLEETNFHFLNTRLKVPSKGFFQINQFLLDTWIQTIKRLLPIEANVLELFCGCGTIGIALRDQIKTLYGIESHDKSIQYAKQNAKTNGANSFVYEVMDLYLKPLPKYLNKYSTWIVNPPRAGLSEGLIESVTHLQPKTILYSSCNPNTLRRDTTSLEELGYQIDSLHLFDFFPRTNHYEALVRLQK